MSVPVNDQPIPHATSPADGRPFTELRSTGLLWLINRVVFHPRGFALALITDSTGEVTGWDLSGDGHEVWTFEGVDEDEVLARVRGLLGP